MNALLAALLTFLAAIGWLTVITRDPVRQAIMLGMLGFALAALFFALQAPDVALSEIVVGGGAIPIMLLLAIAKIRSQSARADEQRRDRER